MKITGICIGDARIVEYIIENEVLTMVLEDYQASVYEVLIDGLELMSVKGSIGFDLSHGEFKKLKGKYHWSFCDEDGAVLKMIFEDYRMSLIQS